MFVDYHQHMHTLFEFVHYECFDDKNFDDKNFNTKNLISVLDRTKPFSRSLKKNFFSITHSKIFIQKFRIVKNCIKKIAFSNFMCLVFSRLKNKNTKTKIFIKQNFFGFKMTPLLTTTHSFNFFNTYSTRTQSKPIITHSKI